MLRKIKRWLWEHHNGAVLALAECRQTILIGMGQRDANLDKIITKLRAERDSI